MNRQHATMLRGAALPGLVALVGCAIGAGVLAGAAGLAGAGVAGLVVALVLGLGLVVMVVSEAWAPTATTTLALMTYGLSTLAVAAVLISAGRADWVSRPAFAVTAVVVTVAWLGGLLRAHAAWTRQHAPPDVPRTYRRYDLPDD